MLDILKKSLLDIVEKKNYKALEMMMFLYKPLVENTDPRIGDYMEEIEYSVKNGRYDNALKLTDIFIEKFL